MTYGKRKAMMGVYLVLFLVIYFADNTEEKMENLPLSLPSRTQSSSVTARVADAAL